MVKLQDGSMVLASQLLSGAGEDDDGNPIKFEKNENALVPTYKAEADMNDGSGRKKVYTFDIVDTQVRVSVSTVEPESESEGDKDKDKPDKPKETGTINLETEPPTTEARVIKTNPSVMENKKTF